MEGLLTALESLFDEWQQYPILLVSAVKERADVTLRAKRRSGETNRRFALTRGSPAKFGIEPLLSLILIVDGVHTDLLSSESAPVPPWAKEIYIQNVAHARATQPNESNSVYAVTVL